AHSLQPAQSVPEPPARCLEVHRGYSFRSIGAPMAGPGDRRLAPRRTAGALDQEAIGRAQPVGAPAARSGALALFRFGGDHAAIPPAWAFQRVAQPVALERRPAGSSGSVRRAMARGARHYSAT